MDSSATGHPLSLSADTPDGRARAAALDAVGGLEARPAAAVTYRSRGSLLIAGPGRAASAAAARLADSLSCTVLATDGFQDPGLLHGILHSVSGHLGQFHVSLQGPDGPVGLQALTAGDLPSVDLVLDLTDPPAIGGARKPPGYFAPAGDGDALEEAVRELPELVGELAKPRYLVYDPNICAHARSGIRGCTRCLDACPSEAIRSLGERIEPDPYLCQGVGSCATACPTGALRYDYPRPADLLERLKVLLGTYRKRGGERPLLLFYDAGAGRERVGCLVHRLPEYLIPLEVEEVASLGMEVWLAALAYGANRVLLLGSAQTDAEAWSEILRQAATVASLLEGMGYPAEALAPLDDPADSLFLEAIADAVGLSVEPAGFAALDEKRTTIRLALDHLHRQAPRPRPLALLPEGAPFGEVWLSAERCTLCMACVSQCPGKALQAGEESPRLGFIEDNCVQCGLCARSCPENAIGPSPRYLFDAEQRRRLRILKEEEPFLCIRCGKPFATRGVIERVAARLSGHPRFGSEEMERIRMCEDCRVRDLYAREPGTLAREGTP